MTKVSLNFNRILALVFLPLVLYFFAAESIDKAYNKDFWGDEATDVFTTMPSSPVDMLTGHIQNQQTGSPLYFIAQHFYVSHVFKAEKAAGKGLDWRVSLRAIPLYSLMLGMILFVLLLLELAPLTAILAVIFLTTYAQTVWFAAETRIYATWLATCLMFLATSIRFFTDRTKVNLSLWIISIILCMSIAISSPLFIFLTAGLFVLDLLLQRSIKSDIRFILKMSAGLLVCFALFKLWNLRSNNHFSLTNFKEPFAYYVTHFTKYGLDMYGGVKGLIVSILCAVALLALPGRFITDQREVRLLRGIALSALGLIFAGFAIYVAQIGVGYFFAERHVIFALAARAILRAAVLGLIIKVLWNSEILRSFFRHKSVVVLLIFGIAIFDWANWRIKQFRAGIPSTATYAKPYCSGPVYVEGLTADQVDKSEGQTLILSITNQKRHSGMCVNAVEADVKSNAGMVYDYNPAWIYN